MKKGNWRERLDQLERNVGHGVLEGGYNVNQRYAADQHVKQHYNHPRGGGPDYVSIPVERRHKEWFRGIADGLLDGNAPARMVDAMDDLDAQVRVLAPLDENDLRRSGAYTVTDGGQVHADRPAEQPRLTEQQLAAKRRRRGR